jgi:uncharacterized DUF497 family protein
MAIGSTCLVKLCGAWATAAIQGGTALSSRGYSDELRDTLPLDLVLRSSIITMECVGCDWDDRKHAENWRKHRVKFEDACCVFRDDNYIEVYEDREDDEDRWRVTGRVGETVLVVVYTERNGMERIISARRADREERNAYYAQFIP